jgi:preprotein translocase subunit YajC
VNASSIVTLVLLGGIFYLFLIAPQRRRARAQQEMLSRLRPGARVQTTTGMLATVVQMSDDQVRLEIAPGVVAEFVRGAVARVFSDGEALDDADGADEAGEAFAADDADHDAGEAGRGVEDVHRSAEEPGDGSGASTDTTGRSATGSDAPGPTADGGPRQA